MAEVVRTVTIAAERGAIWRVLADFAHISTWAPNVDHSCLLSEQTEGVGTVRRIQTGRMTVVETVEHWEPGVALRYAITGLPAVICSVATTWQLTADGARTGVMLTTEVDAGPRPPQQLIAKLVGRRFAQTSEQMLTGLETFITQHAREAGTKP